MKDFLDIPFYQRNKRIPKILPNLKFAPLNEEFGKLTTNMISKDDLRPVMTGNYFNKEEKQIVGTDAHKLYLLKMNKKSEKFDGIYPTKQMLQKWYKNTVDAGATFDLYLNRLISTDKLKIEGKYPNYEAVIPNYRDNTNIYIDYQKLYWFATVMTKAKVLLNNSEIKTETTLDKLSVEEKESYQKGLIKVYKDSYINVINPYTNFIVLQIKENDEIVYFGVNALMLHQILKFALQYNNITDGWLSFYAKNRAILFSLDKGINTNTVPSFEELLLLMPVMLPNQELQINPDFFPDLKIIYDLDNNTIISKGLDQANDKIYEINEDLGFKPIKSDQIRKKTTEKPDLSDKPIIPFTKIEKRIEGLKIALELATKTEKKLIQKRIKGLEIARDLENKDDLPFAKGGETKGGEIKGLSIYFNEDYVGKKEVKNIITNIGIIDEKEHINDYGDAIYIYADDVPTDYLKDIYEDILKSDLGIKSIKLFKKGGETKGGEFKEKAIMLEDGFVYFKLPNGDYSNGDMTFDAHLFDEKNMEADIDQDGDMWSYEIYDKTHPQWNEQRYNDILAIVKEDILTQ